MKVDVQTSKTTSETARSLAWTDNGGKISSLSPSLRKILAGLSIGQLMVVAVSAATLGAFVNSNVSIIEYKPLSPNRKHIPNSNAFENITKDLKVQFYYLRRI